MSDINRLIQYDAFKKSIGVAYLLLFLVGWLGIHRFYLDRHKTAVVMLVLSWIPISVIFGLPPFGHLDFEIAKYAVIINILKFCILLYQLSGHA